MCGHQHLASCLGCSHALSRRGFLTGCGAAAAAGLAMPGVASPAGTKGETVRVAIVFLSNSAEREIWPHPGFDCAGRHEEILKVLKAGCPEVEFVPVVVPAPRDIEKAMALKDSVDGYLVYTVTLNWGFTGCLGQIGKLKKPMLVADEYLGGSGVFLTGLSAMARQGIAAGAVSTTRLEDLAAVARTFADVKKPGTTPESFARQCQEAYRRTFGKPGDSMSMLMARILTGRAGYVSDPSLDTSKNQIVYSHCMAHTKVFGPQGPSNKFRIRTLHNRDPRGCCAESFLPEGYMTTSFRTSVGRKKLVLHQAKAVGNLDADRGCRTQLLGDVRGDIQKLFYQWDLFGWHRVTVYGDLREPLLEFAKALGLEVVEEA